MNNLALTYKTLARYTEAEPLYRRAIEIDEKALGKDHPDVATAYNNLASLLEDQGKYAEAEPLYSAGDRDRRKGFRQGSSRRCDSIQQSRRFA